MPLTVQAQRLGSSQVCTACLTPTATLPLLRRHLALAVWLGLLFGLSGSATAASPPLPDLRRALCDSPSGAIFVIAHRGDWRNHPENSIPAIESCIAAGFEMVEVDLQRTRDGHLILMHDPTLDRTTTGKGPVADLTLEEVKSLKLRDGLSSPTGFDVPTLREALELARGRIYLNLDKGYRFLAEVLPLLAETGTTGLVLIKGPGSVAEVRASAYRILDHAAYMPVINLDRPGASAALRDWILEARPCAVELVFATWTPEVEQAFARCRQSGVRIWVNTLWPHLAGGLSDDAALRDADAVYGVWLARGVTMLQTDRPALLEGYLAARAGAAAVPVHPERP
jgi:glycerophosphoryl diester phosphodiesterase